MDKKKAMQVFVSIFVGLLFLSSYAVFVGSNGSQTAKTTTTLQVQTFYGFSIVNATILNYSNNLQITATCKNYSGTLNYISNITAALEANGSVANVQNMGDYVLVQTGRTDTEEFYKSVISKMNSSYVACAKFTGNAEIELPPVINFTVAGSTSKGYPIQIEQSMRSAQIPLNLSYSENSIKIRIAANLEANGTIYQINITSV
ncbi:MAG: hypothetical protein M1156_00660 [Candidatus Marsarchaeota archaeon]|nr:hypothetical protein [Candidatus Marsarchaeota archaeon]